MRTNVARQSFSEPVVYTPEQVAALARASAQAVGGSHGVKALCASALELCDAAEAWVLLDEDVVAHASVHPGPRGRSMREFPFVHGRRRGALVLVDATTVSVAPALCELIAIALAKDQRRRKSNEQQRRLIKQLATHRRRIRYLRSHASRSAHDLKAPLVAIKGYVDMMLRGMAGAPTEQMRRYLDRIGAAVERERQLIDLTVSARSWGDDEAHELSLLLGRFPRYTRPVEPAWISGPRASVEAMLTELEGLHPRSVALAVDEFRSTVTATLGRAAPRRRLARLGGWVSKLGGTLNHEGTSVSVVLPAFTPR